MTRAPARRTMTEAAGLGHSDPQRLVGIARMAAASPQVRERAEVEYFALESRSALNRESSGRLPFAWTINPYRGCEFGCKYCYASYTHEVRFDSPRPWSSAVDCRKAPLRRPHDGDHSRPAPGPAARAQSSAACEAP